MGELLSPGSMLRQVEALAAGKFLQDPLTLIGDGLDMMRPPERISTVECAAKYRKIRTIEGGALVQYDPKRTPYNIAKMDALDDPNCERVVIVKPSRSGGTAAVENYLFKMIMFGPMGDVGWYLNSGDAVKRYAERVIKPMFEDHPELAAKIGKGRSDDNDAAKRISGHMVEWLPANDGGFRNREFVFGVADEPDGWTKYSETPGTQLDGRMKNAGRRKKQAILSHPDKGWRAGVAAAWEQTSRGIYIMRCAECDRFAAAHATKYWSDVPEFTLHYQRDLYDRKTGTLLKKRDDLTPDERIELAEESAGMLCPHCNVILDDAQRFAMVDEAGENGWWMHRGQALDPDRGIEGEPEQTRLMGFWDHGLMLKNSTAAELARAWEEALIKYERSGGKRVKELREVSSKLLGEIFEGKAGLEGASAAQLRKRSEPEDVLPLGHFPTEALFITAAIDVGAGKFDVSFRAWDRSQRSWWLDRKTLRQRLWGPNDWRDIRTRERIEDWDILIDQVILRTFPIVNREGWAMPVAAVAIDVSDGNVTWLGREFATRCLRRGLYWGDSRAPWLRVQLIQGSPSAKTPLLPTKPRIADAKGRLFAKGVQEWTVGAHEAKELALDRLAISDGGPGQCHFADGIASNYYDEYFNEPLIDGKFERQGPNESLDLFGYEEAARLMLKPDRAAIRWDQSMMPPGEEWHQGLLPVWAQPVSLMPKGGDLADEAGAGSDEGAAAKPKTVFDKHRQLNARMKR